LFSKKAAYCRVDNRARLGGAPHLSQQPRITTDGTLARVLSASTGHPATPIKRPGDQACPVAGRRWNHQLATIMEKTRLLAQPHRGGPLVAGLPARWHAAVEYISVHMLEIPPKISHFFPRASRLLSRRPRSASRFAVMISYLNRASSVGQRPSWETCSEFPTGSIRRCSLRESAESESVQLRAQRAILLDQITVGKHANLEYRVS